MSALYVVILCLLAGLAMPLGAKVAFYLNVKSDSDLESLYHGVTAFGAGALLSAVALVLVPEGSEALNLLEIILSFLGGGLVFMMLDIVLSSSKTKVSQLLAMMSDFVPESIALGAAVATGSPSVAILAFLIAIQNLPEGFNAFREMNSTSGKSPQTIIRWFTTMAFFFPVAGLVGYLWLSSNHEVIASIMLFAAGGILYSVFQDIAPQVKLEKHWSPPLGAVLGFLLGVIGMKLTS